MRTGLFCAAITTSFLLGHGGPAASEGVRRPDGPQRPKNAILISIDSVRAGGALPESLEEETLRALRSLGYVD